MTRASTPSLLFPYLSLDFPPRPICAFMMMLGAGRSSSSSSSGGTWRWLSLARLYPCLTTGQAGSGQLLCRGVTHAPPTRVVVVIITTLRMKRIGWMKMVMTKRTSALQLRRLLQLQLRSTLLLRYGPPRRIQIQRGETLLLLLLLLDSALTWCFCLIRRRTDA